MYRICKRGRVYADIQAERILNDALDFDGACLCMLSVVQEFSNAIGVFTVIYWTEMLKWSEVCPDFCLISNSKRKVSCVFPSVAVEPL